ncbi:hypothetical protein OHA21_20580 [Actinoplanes sp. NBC_00393]|uniref:hypothetical protein n=1 Tax=Actinoplanes sp. NBC_00393 TaxID=2975953 RepID=UPI002E209D70
MRELTGRLESADARGDQAAGERLQAELDALLAEVRRMTGRGGRARAFPAEGERARTAVRKAIKRAIDEVAAGDPGLGRALAATVRTGQMCCYSPDPACPVVWRFLDP